jgi:hypothetical protein
MVHRCRSSPRCTAAHRSHPGHRHRVCVTRQATRAMPRAAAVKLSAHGQTYVHSQRRSLALLEVEDRRCRRHVAPKQQLLVLAQLVEGVVVRPPVALVKPVPAASKHSSGSTHPQCSTHAVRRGHLACSGRDRCAVGALAAVHGLEPLALSAQHLRVGAESEHARHHALRRLTRRKQHLDPCTRSHTHALTHMRAARGAQRRGSFGIVRDAAQRTPTPSGHALYSRPMPQAARSIANMVWSCALWVEPIFGSAASILPSHDGQRNPNASAASASSARFSP